MKFAKNVICTLLIASGSTSSAGTLIATYATYFGGTGDDYVVASALSPLGELILVGITTSKTLPGTSRAFQQTIATGVPNNRDVFVAKFDSTGRVLQWATFLGGDGEDNPVAVAVDPGGNIYITGTTNSIGFPVSPGAYRSKMVQNQVSSFLAKISPDGRSLLYSSYLPQMIAAALSVNGSGEAYVAAQAFTSSDTYITSGAINVGGGVNSGISGVSLLRMNGSGTSLVYGAYLGGAGFNGSKPTAIRLDSAGNAYLVGSTAQGGTAVTTNALQSSYSNQGLTNSIGPGAFDNGFLIAVNPSGSRVLYGTFFGPRFAGTSIRDLAVGADGSIYFTGATNATSLTATAGAYQSIAGRGFIGKLTPGSAVLDSFSYLPDFPIMYVGGQTAYLLLDSSRLIELSLPTLSLRTSAFSFSGINPISILVNSQGSIWASGSCDICPPASAEGFQAKPNGRSDAFLVQLTEVSPTVNLVGSSATFNGQFTAGQLVSIFGKQLGPETAVGAVAASGLVSTSNAGTRVLFDGIPAPILYASANQINTSIPCSLTNSSVARVSVEYLGVQSEPISLALSPSAPGIFTVSGTGTGQGAILNQDNTLNSKANPAERGSIVQVFGTGLGSSTPQCTDGKIYASSLPISTLSVVGGINDVGTGVLYAGQAPGAVSGLAQFNILIPIDSLVGAVPVSLKVGDQYSQPGVTVVVK